MSEYKLRGYPGSMRDEHGRPKQYTLREALEHMEARCALDWAERWKPCSRGNDTCPSGCCE